MVDGVKIFSVQRQSVLELATLLLRPDIHLARERRGSKSDASERLQPISNRHVTYLKISGQKKKVLFYLGNVVVALA